MLRITDSGSAHGAKEYFDTALRQADYYAEGQEIVGLWHGDVAKLLGLEGAVTRDAFQALIDNRHPYTGEQLTPRMKADRRPGTDFTFNAPKSVSLLYALHQDERIVEGFRRAVEKTMAEVERDVKTRVRAHGRNEDRVSGNLLWAEFLHTTARPVDGVPDPHLHIHAYVPNLTYDTEERRWKAIQLGDIKGDGAYYEAAFLSRLAVEMRALGYEIERSGRSWDVAGLPRGLIERFSRRTAEIERAAAAQGITDPVRKGELGARTRERKAESLSLSELRDAWIARLGPSDRKALDKAAADAEVAPLAVFGTATGAAVEHALRHGFERASVVPERSLLAAALHRAYGDAGPESVRREAAKAPLIRRMVEGRALVTTKEVLAEERAMLAFARDGRLTCRPLAPGPGHGRLGGLNEAQRAAVAHVTRSPDRLMILRGGAGTGKTTLMRAAVGAINDGGGSVFVFAPTSAATDVLRAEGLARAETLQRLLIDTEMQRSVRGAVLWIDEAGLVSVPDMGRLTRIADAQGCRVILSGDSAQHGAIGRGDALRLLESRAGIKPAELREIVRQRGAYKEAVAAVSAGNVTEGLTRFAALGAVIEADGAERLDRLAADYASELKAGRSVLVVSPTHREKDAVTACIRDKLIAEGQLDAAAHRVGVLRDLRWTEAERADAGRYRGGEIVKFIQNAPGFDKGMRLRVGGVTDGRVDVAGAAGAHVLPLDAAGRFKVYAAETIDIRGGDRIRITENGMSQGGHRLVNGSIYHVGAVDNEGNIHLRENGWIIGRDFGHLDHGYCSTSVSAQGRTVDTVLVAMGRDSAPAMSREQFYVTVSRGRQAMRLYTDDRAAIAQAIQRSGARGGATELMEAAVDRKAAPAPRMDTLRHHADSVRRLVAARAREHAMEAEHHHAPQAQPFSRAIGMEHEGTLGAHEQEAGRG